MIRDYFSKRGGLGEIGDDSSCNGQRLVALGGPAKNTGVLTWQGGVCGVSQPEVGEE